MDGIFGSGRQRSGLNAGRASPSAQASRKSGKRFGAVDALGKERVTLLTAIFSWALLTISASLSTGCFPAQGGASGGDGHRLRVLCTTGMIADVVRHLGGAEVFVDQLMPPGVDPHLYRPTARDKWRINAADAVFYNGLHLEGRLEPLLARRARFMPVFAVTEKLRQEHPELLRRLSDDPVVYDPHVWLDPLLWAKCVDYIAACLGKVDPKHADVYMRRGEEYIAQLEELDRYARQRLAHIPPQRRVLVTTHDAFGYFGHRYGLEVASLQGLSTLDEVDLVTMNRLINKLVNEKIPAVFVENSVSPRVLQAVVAGCQAQRHTIRIGGELYADCLGPPGSPGETFFGAFRWNVDTIAAALGD